MLYFAHSLPHVSDENRWEHLFSTSGDGHLNRVAAVCVALVERMALPNATVWKEFCRLMCLWHDLGKFQDAFQHYLRKGIGKVDHSLAGALYAALDAFSLPVPVGDLLAYAIAGHHSGLPEGAALFTDRFLKQLGEWRSHAPAEVFDTVQASEDWLKAGHELLSRQSSGAIPGFIALFFDEKSSAISRGFAVAMQTRMLFSLLVDADRLATEAFMNPEHAALRPRWPLDALKRMSSVLESYLARKEDESDGSVVAVLRARIHHACLEAAQKERGVYQLNVPTGGGKTLSSLSFSLRHACEHGMQRVIYVIPYTSIIDQTAREFRQVFASLSGEWGHDCVFEHHSALRDNNAGLDQDEIETRSYRLEQLAENWDAPLVVTTSVQFFESLFARSPSAARKLHNMANSVLVFDEAQTLPTHLLAPCLEAMKTLHRDYGCTLVLCTATQPALTRQPWFPHGWEQDQMQSLLGRTMEEELTQRMKRVRVQFLGKLDTAALVTRISAGGQSSCLCIVNHTRQAQALYDALKASTMPPKHLMHLSARMRPTDRESTIDRVTNLLAKGEPVTLVATRVVEAGVDLSFPVVYRDRAGLDSIAQAAGRCNRHGENPHGGEVFVFESSDYPIAAILDDLKTAARCAEDTLLEGRYDDALAPEAVNTFFERYYRDRGDQTARWGISILKSTELPSPGPNMYRGFSFAEVAEKFHLIEEGQRQLMIPLGEQGQHVLSQLQARERAGYLPGRDLYRELHRLSVAVYENEWNILLQRGLVEFYADGSVAVVSVPEEVYDPELGLKPMAVYNPNNQFYYS